MAFEQLNIYFIEVQQKRWVYKVQVWNDAEMLLKSFWTSHLQMMNWLEPLPYNWTGRRKGIPIGVDQTQMSSHRAWLLLRRQKVFVLGNGRSQKQQQLVAAAVVRGLLRHNTGAQHIF